MCAYRHSQQRLLYSLCVVCASKLSTIYSFFCGLYTRAPKKEFREAKKEKKEPCVKARDINQVQFYQLAKVAQTLEFKSKERLFT